MRPIDVRVLEQLRGVEARSRPGLLRKLVAAFSEVAPAGVATLRSTLAARDAEVLWRAAHKLRSAANAIGAAQVAARCAALEAAGRAGSLDGVPPLVGQLATDVAIAVALLGELCGDPAVTAG